MKHKPTLYALERLHAELGGRIKDNKREYLRLVADMKCVERVIRLLAPDFDVSKIIPRRKNKRVSPFKKGAGFKAITDVLRASPEPMTSREVVLAILRQAGDPEPPIAVVRAMVPTVHSSLRRHSGSIERVGEGMPAKWRLAKDP